MSFFKSQNLFLLHPRTLYGASAKTISRIYTFLILDKIQNTYILRLVISGKSLSTDWFSTHSLYTQKTAVAINFNNSSKTTNSMFCNEIFTIQSYIVQLRAFWMNGAERRSRLFLQAPVSLKILSKAAGKEGSSWLLDVQKRTRNSKFPLSYNWTGQASLFFPSQE